MNYSYQLIIRLAGDYLSLISCLLTRDPVGEFSWIDNEDEK